MPSPRPALYDQLTAWLSRAAEQVGTSNACLHMLSTDGKRIVCQAVSHSLRATHLAYGLDLTDCPAVHQVLDSGQSLSIASAVDDTRVAMPARRRYGLRSIHYEPVRIGGDPRAVLVLSDQRERAWSEVDRTRAAALAHEAEQLFADPLDARTSGPWTSEAAMLAAVPGTVMLVDRNLLTVNVSRSIDPRSTDLADDQGAVSLNELLEDRDRGGELQTALLDVLAGERPMFEGLFKTAASTWWVATTRIFAGPHGDQAMLGVHARPALHLPEEYQRTEHLHRLDALARLAGSVAHEVNNALQIIRVAIDDETAADAPLPIVRAAADRAARVTSDLLDFARPTRTTLEPCDLSAFVRARVDLLQRTVGDLRLRVRDDERPRWTRLDPVRMEMALVNLCKNAAQASPPTGEVTVEVASADTGSRAPEYHLIAVSDDGPGFPSHVAAEPGRPFVSTSEGGSGLGLAIVHEILESHAGRTVVLREAGRGARVELRLFPDRPRDTAAVVAPDTTKTPASAHSGLGAAPVALPQPRNVLLVEDEQMLRDLLEMVLDRHGYHVHGAGDANAAQTLLEEIGDHVDIALLDLTLPAGSGTELHALLRERWPELPIVLMSGFAEQDRIQAAMRSPSTVFLAKPFSPNALLDTLDRLLTHQRS